MFKIGEFSTFTRVSVKMLRHYDELGLLKPAFVAPHTGYRYYSADQLSRLNRLVAFKDLGFSLEQIGQLLDDELPTEQLWGMLRLRRAEVERQLRIEERKLNRIEARLAQLDHSKEMQGNEPHYDVVLRAIEPQMVASIRQTTTAVSNDITQLFETLETAVGQYNARATRPPCLIYHDTEYQEGEQDVEVAVPINAPLPATDLIHVRELAGQEMMACCIHTGKYDTLPQAFAALMRWIEANKLYICGPTREVYLRFGAQQEGYELPSVYLTTQSSEFVTELQIPVIHHQPTIQLT